MVAGACPLAIMSLPEIGGAGVGSSHHYSHSLGAVFLNVPAYLEIGLYGLRQGYPELADVRLEAGPSARQVRNIMASG